MLLIVISILLLVVILIYMEIAKTISIQGKKENIKREEVYVNTVFPSKEEIRDRQKCLMDVLIAFDEMCKKQNIKYFLFSGTLLGAIRHKGFIPWDDDIDLIVPRNDYNRLLKNLNVSIGKYHMEQKESDPTFISFGEGLDEDSLSIDIFPLDALHGSYLKRKIYWEFMRMYGFIIGMKNEEQIPFKQFRIPGLFVYYIIPLNGVTLRKIYSRLMVLMDVEKEKNLGLLRSPYDTLRHITYEKNQFEKSINVFFEGRKFPAPIGYHSILTQLYGDYMKYPEEKKRVPHHYIDYSEYTLKINRRK